MNIFNNLQMALRKYFPGALFFMPLILLFKLNVRLPVTFYLFSSFLLLLILPARWKYIALFVLLPLPVSGPFVFNIGSGTSWLYDFISERLDLVSGPGKSLAFALCTGNTDALAGYEKQIFYNSGNAHLLAVSGMHFGILCGIVGGLLSLIFKGKIRLFIIGIAAVVLCCLIGPLPSLIRALLFVLFYLFSKIFELRWKAIHFLVMAFVFHVYLFPGHMERKGFILSYLAVSGLFLLTNCLKSGFLRHLPAVIKDSWAASISCFIFTAPYLLLFSDSLPLGGILLSPVVIPLFTLFYLQSLLLIVTGPGIFEGLHALMYRVFSWLLQQSSNIPAVPNYIFWSIITLTIIFLYVRLAYRQYSWERIHGLQFQKRNKTTS